jgi:hypothetical protein
MTADEFIVGRPLGLTESELFILLAAAVYQARLEDGRHVRDAIGFRQWFLELAAASKKEGQLLGDHSIPRHNFPCGDFCPRCGHVHQGEKECGEPLGGGRICRCELEIGA